MISRWSKPAVAAAIALTMAALSTPVMAQFDGPPPGGGGGFHGGPGGPGGPGGFRGGPGGGPMGRTLTVADVPVHVLAVELSLTDDQKTKIADIKKSIDSQRRDLFGTPGERPDPDTMQENFQKMRDLDKSATTKVEAVLSSSQQDDLKPLLKSLGTLRGVNIPIELYSDLKLTDDEKSAIADLSASNKKAMQAAFSQGRDGGFDSVRTAMDNVRTKTDTKLKSILTDKQYALIEAFKAKHPRRGFGGPGGPGGGGFGGGPGGGGPGGPGGGFGGGPGGGGPGGDGGPGPNDDMGPPPGGGGPGGDDMPPPPGGFDD